MQQRSLLILAAILSLTSASAYGQAPTKIPRIAFLSAVTPASISARVDAFRQGLRELGHEEGKKPSELPVEQPKKFEFIVNLNAAKQIGLTIPPNVLARADKVIR